MAMTTQSRQRPATASILNRLVIAALLGTTLAAPRTSPAQAHAGSPDSLTSAEFWNFFSAMSEPGGYFLSENFVSNEMSFQEVIPVLQKTLTKQGVYLGVGPEQNFTYIANLAPRLAVIFDIRRQNAMQHLMYKALFEMAPTRAEFVALLFSRPAVAQLGARIPVKALFDSAAVALPDEAAYQRNRSAIIEHLTGRHRFALPMDDIETIQHVYDVFFAAGPDVNYGYRSGIGTRFRSTYPNYGMLQSATNADSVPMAFLASEENYQAIRLLQLRNLIIPVVGDFGGPSAIRDVGTWLRERQMTVTAFYVSNVEQYLFRDGGASDRFYANVSALPIDSTSHFIRSVPRTGGMNSMLGFQPAGGSGPVGAGGIRFVITRDALGTTTTQTFRDSSGVTLVQTTVDSSRQDSSFARALVARDSVLRNALQIVAGTDTALQNGLRAMNQRRDSIAGGAGQWQVFSRSPTTVMMGGLLTSGIASMQHTLDSYFLGDLKTYGAVVGMTRTSGWR